MCGREWVLAREVTKAYLDVGLPVTQLFAQLMLESELWDLVLSTPPDGGRLIVVQGAEKLRQTDKFAVLAAAEGMDTAFTVFVSADEDFARTEVDQKRVLAPHLAVLQASKHAQLVRCNTPSKEEDVVKIVAAWWPGAGANLAYELLTKCGGSLLFAWQACDKVRRAGLPAEQQTVSLVSIHVPGRDFADKVIAGDKKEAVAVARFLRHNETGAALGILSSRLGALGAIWAGKQRGWDATELAMRLKLDRYLLRLLAPYAGSYGPERVARCQEVLAVAESSWRAGAREGVLEAVTALW